MTAGVSRTRLVLGAVAAVVLLGLGFAVLAGTDLGTDRDSTTTSTSASATPTAERAAGSRSGLPVVRAADLPPEARRTLMLIARGGPFPYARDGVVFGNRERLLPRQTTSYYREYTVPTPGESDRGARRIVTGRAGETFYTADHYRSFREVLP